jgi:hypothetical protein
MKNKEHIKKDEVKKLAVIFARLSIEWSCEEWAIFGEATKVVQETGLKEEPPRWGSV